ncbi:MAG: DUF6262 family protein [Acidimicrobiales bacterium]
MSARTAAMSEGRRADSARRRQRVLKAVEDLIGDGEPLSLSRIARRAGVDRSFLYRHGDLLEQLHARQAEPLEGAGVGPAVTRASLEADLLNAQQRAARFAARAQQLEQRLSRALGDDVWRESGLGAPDDIHQLERRIVTLEQQIIDLRCQLEERDQELAAARAANRELMARINAPGATT